MAYGDGKSGRPAERASKVGHASLVEHPLVLRLLQESSSTAVQQRRSNRNDVHDLPVPDVAKAQNLRDSGFDRIIAIDSGRRTITLPDRDLRSVITFLSIGAVHLDVARQLQIESRRFFTPAEINECHRVEKFDLALPEQFLSRNHLSEIDSFRLTLHDFLLSDDERGDSLFNTMEWLLNRQWRGETGSAHRSYPRKVRAVTAEDNPSVSVLRYEGWDASIDEDKDARSLLGDLFEAHELAGRAEDASSHAMRIIEQLLAVHMYRRAVRDGVSDTTLIIVDGPLTVFKRGMGRNRVLSALLDLTADMAAGRYGLEPMYVVGLEKGGVLATHAKSDLSGEEDNDLRCGTYVVADHEHIRRHLPHMVRENDKRYGRNTYWAVPVLVRSRSNVHYAASLLSNDIEQFKQRAEQLWQLDRIVLALDGLETALYEDALLPIALANNAVSLSQTPGEAVLQQLMREKLSRN